MRFSTPVLTVLLASLVTAVSATHCDADFIVSKCIDHVTQHSAACVKLEQPDCECTAAREMKNCYNNCPDDPAGEVWSQNAKRCGVIHDGSATSTGSNAPTITGFSSEIDVKLPSNSTDSSDSTDSPNASDSSNSSSLNTNSTEQSNSSPSNTTSTDKSNPSSTDRKKVVKDMKGNTTKLTPFGELILLVAGIVSLI